MTFEEAISRFNDIINQEIWAFKRRHGNWRYEFEDLKQECLLHLWEKQAAWQVQDNAAGYFRKLVRNALIDIERRFSKDALYHANNYGLNPGTALEIEAR